MLPSHDLLAYAGTGLALVLLVNLIARRIPLLGTVLRLAAWACIAVLLVGAVRQRGMFDPHFATLGRLLTLEGAESQQVEGRELRVPLSRDGHFWVRARVNGVERRLLVDSGATVTALSVQTASAAGLHPQRSPFPVVLKTANGAVLAQTAVVASLRIGNIVAHDLPVVVSPTFGDTEVIGMNLLRKLKSWRVEGDVLILEPHHPQADART